MGVHNPNSLVLFYGYNHRKNVPTTDKSAAGAANPCLAILLAAIVAVTAACSNFGRTASGTINVGVLHSLTGTMAISEKSVRDATLMAIDEINEKGGVLGKKITPFVVDSLLQRVEGLPRAPNRYRSAGAR